MPVRGDSPGRGVAQLYLSCRSNRGNERRRPDGRCDVERAGSSRQRGAGVSHKHVDLAVVSFRFRTESSVTEPVRFAWPSMPVAEIDGIREALAPHIPAPWVPLSQLDD